MWLFSWWIQHQDSKLHYFNNISITKNREDSHMKYFKLNSLLDRGNDYWLTTGVGVLWRFTHGQVTSSVVCASGLLAHFCTHHVCKQSVLYQINYFLSRDKKVEPLKQIVFQLKYRLPYSPLGPPLPDKWCYLEWKVCSPRAARMPAAQKTSPQSAGRNSSPPILDPKVSWSGSNIVT